MTEWLDHYEKVAQRQQEYLKKIKDLRQRLKNKDEHYVMMSIESVRHFPRDLYRRQYHHGFHKCQSSSTPSSLSLLLGNSFYPKYSLPAKSMRLRESVQLPMDNGNFDCFISGERLHPKLFPKRLAPISRHSKEALEKEPLKENLLNLERNKTDYEPIEDIAKRNRIQFSRYLKSRDGKDDPETRSGSKVERELYKHPISIIAVMGDDAPQCDV